MQVLNYIVFLSFLFFSVTGFSQELFEPSFKDITPLWQTRLVESAVTSDSFDLYYYTPGFNSFYSHGDAVYINYTTSNGLPFRQGSSLVKFDVNTGSELARFSANVFSSEIPEYFSGVHFLEDEILLTGTEQANAIEGNQYIQYNRSKNWRLDYDDLSLIESRSNQDDTIGVYYPGFYSRNYLPTQHGFFEYQSTQYFGSDIIFDYYDQDMMIDSSKHKVYPYETSSTPEINEVYSRLAVAEENRVAAFVFYRNNNTLLYPQDAEFKLFEIQGEEVQNILTTNIKDYCYPFGGSQVNNFRLFGGSGQYAMYRIYYANSDEIDIRNWFLWLNADGDVVVAKDKLHYEEHNYYVLRPLSFDSLRLYALAYPSISGEDGYDVVKLRRDGEIELVGQLLTEGSINFINSVQGQLKGDKVVLIGRPILNDEVWGGPILYSFSSEDLGIDAETSDIASPLVASRFEVFPNPATEYIQLDIDLGQYQYDIINEYGVKVVTRACIDDMSRIDVSSLAAGPYFIRMSRADGKKFISSFVKI